MTELSRRGLLTGLLVSAPAAAFAAGKSKGASEETYVRYAAVSSGVALAGGRRGVMTVEIGLDTPDPALRTRVEQTLPRLRAAWFQTTSTFAATLRPAALPDAGRLSEALQAATDKQLGKPGARVLIGSILIN